MANIIITWGLSGLAIGGLMARILHSQHLALNLIGGAATCILAGLLLAPQLGLDNSTFTITLLGLIIGGLATQLLSFTFPKKAAED